MSNRQRPRRGHRAKEVTAIRAVTHYQNPVHLSDAQTRAMRQAYADDLCTCGHDRGWHYYGPDGATGACHKGPPHCIHYAWQGAGTSASSPLRL